MLTSRVFLLIPHLGSWIRSCEPRHMGPGDLCVPLSPPVAELYIALPGADILGLQRYVQQAGGLNNVWIVGGISKLHVTLFNLRQP